MHLIRQGLPARDAVALLRRMMRKSLGEDKAAARREACGDGMMSLVALRFIPRNELAQMLYADAATLW
jgi:hypothetical protein